MSSLLGRASEESERIERLEALIRDAVDEESDQELRTTLRGLFAELDAARERYWHRARELQRVREALKVTG